MCARISSPTLIVQRTEDQLTPRHHGLALAEAIGPNASIIMIDGGGNRPDVRDPVKFSLMLREFVRIFHERRAASHSQHHPVFAVLSIMTVMLTFLLGVTRVWFSMSRDGLCHPGSPRSTATGPPNG
jgi:hypothetical protein